MRRRNFLKSLGLAGAWMGTPALVTKAAARKNNAAGELVLKGKVQAGAKGLAVPGQDDGADARVLPQGLERLGELGDQRGAERVAHVRAVHPDRGGLGAVDDFDGLK